MCIHITFASFIYNDRGERKTNTHPMAAALESGHSAFILCMLSSKSICPLIPNIHKPIYKALQAIHILNISVIG